MRSNNKIGKPGVEALAGFTRLARSLLKHTTKEIHTMTHHTNHAGDIKKLGEMIQDIDFAMFTTLDRDGSLRSRPMSTQKTEFDGNLWFFTEASSPKADEVEDNQRVNLSYADKDSNRYVSVSGQATLVRDKAKAKELWNPPLKAWFPKGLDDPNLALIRVTVNKAEYWDGPSSKVVQLVDFVKALATGESYEPGENEKITLKTTPSH
jgi:general stress protein 26